MSFRAEGSMTGKILGLLREEILQGKLKSGEKIESIRNLANRFSVSSQVLVSVFRELTKENLVYSRPRSGYFVSERVPGKLGFSPCRIGFLNWKMPLTEKFPLQCFCTLSQQAARQDIQLFLNSGDQMEPLEKWIRNCKLNAIIATGKVDDALILSLRKSAVPFLILGNYPLTEKANILESALAEDVEKKIVSLSKKHFFIRLGALLRKGIRGSEEIRKGLLLAAARMGIPEKNCFFQEIEDVSNGEQAKAIQYFLEEKVFGKNDLIFLNPDSFHSVARYIFQKGIRKESLPHLLLEMAEESEIPFPELAGSFLYGKNDPLPEAALNTMLDILAGRIRKNTILLVNAGGKLKIKKDPK